MWTVSKVTCWKFNGPSRSMRHQSLLCSSRTICAAQILQLVLYLFYSEIYLRTDEKRENRPPDNNVKYNVAKFRRWPAADARDKLI